MQNVNITPEEALELARFIPQAAAGNAADVLVKHLFTYKMTEAEDEQRRDLIGKALIITLYNAGRIDGIRSERARRRAVQA